MRSTRNWNKRVASVRELAQTPGFQAMRDQLIELAHLRPTDRVLDLGAGSGLLTLAAAGDVAHVTAVDISPAMCAELERTVRDQGLTNVDVVTSDAASLPLADDDYDVVLTNYTLHHLEDDGKRRSLTEISRVLRPGGRLVIGDMMFEIGLRSARDRAVIFGIVRKLIRKGPAGVLRLARNAVRVLTGRTEHPASVEWWQQALRQAGFENVSAWRLSHEGGIAVGDLSGQPLSGQPFSGQPLSARRLAGAARFA
ncbi:MAG: class I SAM-dependent methyltransferase [Solirubrobacteraceae bacterium]